MADTRIPMSGQAVDTATPIYQMQQQMNLNQDQILKARQQLNQNAVAAEQVLGQHYKNMDDREKSRLTSTIVGAVQLKNFLANGDKEGAMNFLQRRKQALQSRLANGENIDTQETDYAIQALQSGNTDELERNVDGLVAAGMAYGILQRPQQQNGYLQQFDAVKQAHPDWTEAQVQDYVYTRGNVGKGTTFDDQGNVINQPGAVAAAADRGGSVKFAESQGSKAGQQVVDNQNAIGTLQTMQRSIQAAKQQLQKVSMTGPVLGRTADAARDPEYVNLQRNINEITLLAKDLYNLGSGQGFTDADRDFLQELAGGKYNRAESIKYALDQMEVALQHRAQYLSQQNQGYQQQYGQPSGIQVDATSSEAYTTPSGVNYKVIQ